MVEDLFDLSKTASGDIALEKDNLNLKQLVSQVLIEVGEITESNQIEVSIDEELFIYADGNKMYNVIQNLIENACKYCMDMTRIYIEGYEKNNKVYLEIKNISKYKMEFTEEDIVTRFKRGEVSRTTEGSGLGLAIAKVYTEANIGSFEVKIDGDLFKVILSFENENENKL